MTIREAVQAVPHRENCAVHNEGWASHGEHGPEPCDCDRDERIAKGIEAAMNEVGHHGYHVGRGGGSLSETEAITVAAFMKAAAP